MTVLVTYASKHGSTRDIAERIGDQLRRFGKDVDVRPVSAAGAVDGYEAAVIGSAVYYGSWMKDAAAFVRQHRTALAERPVWLFSSGPTLDPAKPRDVPQTPEAKEVAELEEAITPREHRTFPGRLESGQLSFVERMAIKAVKAPTGDSRDWADIDAWAEGIARALTPAGTAPART